MLDRNSARRIWNISHFMWINRYALSVLDCFEALINVLLQLDRIMAVSYTHLDVYKRQPLHNIATHFFHKFQLPKRLYSLAYHFDIKPLCHGN